MLIKYTKTEEAHDLTDAKIVNVEKDDENCYTAYFEEKGGIGFFFTFTEKERQLFLNPRIVD